MRYFILISVLLVLLQNEASNAKMVDYVQNPRTPVKNGTEKLSSVEWSNIKTLITSPSIDYQPKGKKKVPSSAGKLTVVNPHIVGGNKATRGQFPWQAFIVFDGAGFCGGSLISTQWVLTAAHCVKSYYNFDITLGANDRSEPEAESVRQTTRTKYTHPYYSKYSLANDIAVLRLNTPVIVSAYINVIQLPKISDASNTFVNTGAIVSGWGRTSDGYSISCALRYVQVPVISNVECYLVYGSIVRSSTLCVSTADMKSTCNGDSGSPLIYEEVVGQWTQIGIVSFVSSFGCAHDPAGFTRVTCYLGWISEKTGIAIRP